ncbi:MAG: cytidine deaminase [Flavobacteriales bacterium]|nr:cytidine deaminase [Flavobacteriales bacterium]
MEKFVIHTEVFAFDQPEELALTEQKLLEAATEAMRDAYAPYSRFKVGAAILLENGVVIKGNNQENAAYPSGLCAERVAIYACGANYPGIRIISIAITAGSLDFASDHPIAPCGACRQTMLEYELNQESPIAVIMRGRSGKIYRCEGIKQLLPIFFHEDGLKVR